MDDMLKIVRINAYIQTGKGDVWYQNSKVICVALDLTCAIEKEDTGEIQLTSEDIQGLFTQTFSFLQEGTSKP